MGILIEENWIDRTRNLQCGESGVYESRYETTGELYRGLIKEYGRCAGKVYIDLKTGGRKCVGWVFVKRQKYEDANETYLMETWVSMHEKKPVTTTEHFYAGVNL